MIILDTQKCSGCKLCLYVCPHGVLAMEGRKAKVVAEEKCIECGACQINCDYGALLVTKGTGCLTAIIKEDFLKVEEPGCG